MPPGISVTAYVGIFSRKITEPKGSNNLTILNGAVFTTSG